MNFTYRAFGVRFGANRAIPGLTAETARTPVDVQIEIGSLPDGPPADSPNESHACAKRVTCDGDRPGAFSWCARSGDFRLRYDDGTVFVVDEHGSCVWAVWPKSLTLEDTAVYLLGPVLAFVLRLRGLSCLHASAFSVDGCAVALLGPSGAGKSTTAAAFAGRGFTVLTDDTLALEEQHGVVIANPGYPRLRLWPDAAGILDAVPTELPRLTPNWDKRYLDLVSSRRFEPQPRPLSAVYLLDGYRDLPVAPFVASMPASTALLTLLGHIRGDFHVSKHAHRREFDMLARVVQRMPVMRVVTGSEPYSPASLCDVILENLQSRLFPTVGERETACTI
jgi:hypothetical protein